MSQEGKQSRARCAGVRDREAESSVRTEAHRAVRLLDALDEHPMPHTSHGSDVARSAPNQPHMSREAAPNPRTPRVGTRVARSDLSVEDGECAYGYAIRSIHPVGEGETVAVVLTVPTDDEACHAGDGDRTIRLHITVEQYAALHLRAGSITEEQAEALTEAGRLCMAIQRGMSLLQYGDSSARRLAYKLTAKGIDREVAEAAVVYLAEKGYIREADTARRRAEQGARKLWGARRIREDLRANGFSAESIEEAMSALDEVDFEANCVAVIRHRCRTVPKDRAARQKLVAALMRQGYDMDAIRAAMREVEREDAEP